MQVSVWWQKVFGLTHKTKPSSEPGESCVFCSSIVTNLHYSCIALEKIEQYKTVITKWLSTSLASPQPPKPLW